MLRGFVLLVASVVLALAALSFLPHESLSDRVLPAPSRVYARPILVGPGLGVRSAEIRRHLERVGYRPAKSELVAGRYRVGHRQLEIERRAFVFPDGVEPGGRVTLSLDGRDRVSGLHDARGEPLDKIFLEPEVVGTLFADGDEDRLPVALAQVPDHVVEAVVVTEDRRFRWHPGVDPVRIAGALRANWRAGRIVEGASTLTQQLVKNVYLSPERTWSRKLRETLIAVWIELRYSKDEILEAYLNQIYLGQDGGRAIHGLGRAARFYFGKDVAQLDVAEGALLAGMIRAPSALSPFRHPEAARARRDAVLDRLRVAGQIDSDIHAAARARSLGVRRESRPPALAAHYVDWLRGRLEKRFAGEALARDGFDIFSSLDAGFQRAAEEAVAHELRRLEKGHPRLRRRRDPLQAALIAIEAASGDVVAMVGGRSYAASPYNRATRARRQPGSVFKPFVALAALTARAGDGFTLATLLEDRPLQLQVEGKRWGPSNHDGRHRGPVTLRDALEESLNVPFARLGMEVGLVHVAETARALGIESPLRPIPSLSLGAFEMTPLEVAAAYAVLASGGVARQPRAALAVVEADGRVLWGDPIRERRAFREAETYLVTAALQGVVTRGTGKSLSRLGVRLPVAGKTGTTNDFRDAWFVGYTPDLVVAVWVGFDDAARVGLTGARAALPIYARFLREALGDAASRDFVSPKGVEVVAIDPRTGLRATRRCPGRPEVFLAGTAPAKRACGLDWRGPFEWVRGALHRSQ